MWSLFLPFLTVFLLFFLYLKFFADYFKGENELEGDEVYIDKFNSNINFEIIRYTKWVKIYDLWRDRQIINNDEFDSDIYISSDYHCVSKAIKKSFEIQEIIYDIITDEAVKSISFNKKKIKILFKNEYLGHTNREADSDNAKFKYHKQIKILQDKFLPLLKDTYLSEDKENILFAKQKVNNLDSLNCLYFSLFSGIITQLYWNHFNREYFLMLNNISIGLVTFISLIIFVPFTLYAWYKMSGSVRLHQLLLKHLIFFAILPFFVYSSTYNANYLLDTSKIEIFNTKHTVLRVGGAKHIHTYYIAHDLKNNKNTPYTQHIDTFEYNKFLETKKSQISIKKGWLGYPYVIDIKAIEEDSQ